MTDWDLSQLLSSLHADIENGLRTVRGAFGHPGTKGDASERVWLEMLTKYRVLPAGVRRPRIGG